MEAEASSPVTMKQDMQFNESLELPIIKNK